MHQTDENQLTKKAQMKYRSFYRVCDLLHPDSKAMYMLVKKSW